MGVTFLSYYLIILTAASFDFMMLRFSVLLNTENKGIEFMSYDWTDSVHPNKTN